MKPGRNDPCPCGSGKKYKKCCQEKHQLAAPKPSVSGVAPGAAERHRLVALLNAGHATELESQTRLLLEQYPESGFVWNLLGASLGMQGKDSLPALQKATEFLPNDADVHSNLGNALMNLGRHKEAEASYRRALQIKPDFADAHINLGNALKNIGRLADAETSYRQAIRIKPDTADGHCSLGNILMESGRLDEAEASYRRTLQIKPNYTKAHSSLLFIYNYLHSKPPASMLAEARHYGELVARQARPYKAWSNVPEPARCLRIGLVSGDLHEHPVGYFLESVLTALSAHAVGRLEFFAYHNRFRTSTVTERIKVCCRGWHSVVGLSDEIFARRIHDDGIDILIDLSGHTAYNRLPVFAWKPAPVQATWLGYFATTGVSAMDYLIADPWALPETEEANFTEKIWRLPETYLCFTAPDVDVKIAPLPALANGYITFGCFNNLTKMNDVVVKLWALVLQAAPGSRLLLKTKQLGEATIRQSVIDRFAAYGIDAGQLVLEGPAPRVELLSAYHRVDIALDPFPYPGGTTSVECLWMGVPVLTLVGDSFLSHIGESIQQNAGLPEWIAKDHDDYVARAISHTRDLQYLATLRSRLRQKVLASPIFDAPRFARHFEAAMRGMWAHWCHQQQGQQEKAHGRHALQ